DTDFSATPLHVVARGRAEGLPFVSRAQSMLPRVAARDPLAYDLRPHAVANSGWRILNLLATLAVQSSELEPTVDGGLQQHPQPRGALRLGPAALTGPRSARRAHRRADRQALADVGRGDVRARRGEGGRRHDRREADHRPRPRRAGARATARARRGADAFRHR